MCISFHYFEEQATAIILDADTGPANTRHSQFYMLQRNDENSQFLFIYFIDIEDVDKYEHLVKLCCV